MGITSKLNHAQKKCVKTAGLLSQRTGQLSPGARIGVAVSGGADSMCLLQVLLIRRRIVPFPVELMVLHVNPGFDRRNHVGLARWVAEQGLASHFEVCNIGPEAHGKENRKRSPCFYCSWFRRKRLFELCKKYSLTHLALGHNADDLVENFFLNIVQTGKVQGMISRSAYFGGELTMIRPLLLLEKKYILKAVRAWNLPVVENPCPSSGTTGRSEIREKIELLCGSDKKARQNVINAITRWQLDLDRVIS